MAKRKTDGMKIINAAVFSILVLLVIYKVSPNAGSTQIPMDGFARVNVSIEGTAMIFTGDCRQVTMNVVDTQALSIFNGILKKVDTRPLTHDMMKDILDNFGIKVIAARVESFENEIYYAKIFLQQNNQILELDARPSDAVGIAVRTDTPVYFKAALLETKGTNVCGNK
ncbi:MAG: bifunctional nuclease family protein [Candidatus Aenigmarchaeota archaeon]|nr:bifunctional nuclease family protein [Candidatus Aenigmarchaeota archaeon]